MKRIIGTIALVLLLTPLGCSSTGDTKEAASIPADTHTAVTLAGLEPQKILDQLHVHLLDLKTILLEPAPDMTQVKTQTSWIRKHLTDLKDWSDKYQKSNPPNPLPDKFHIIVADMVQEVERDDMLDKVELQALTVNYTQADHIIANMNTAN